MKIGCHLSIADGIEKAILKVPTLGGNALQIFLASPHGSDGGKQISQEEAEDIQDLLEGSKIYLVVHGNYDLNFCDPSVKWYQKTLINDLKKASQIGPSIGVVIHQGKNLERFGLEHQTGVENYVNRVIGVLDQTKDLKNPIFLENSAHQGTELGYDIEGLSEIWNLFPTKYHSRLGICLDTCHAFVAGALQMIDHAEVDTFFHQFDRLIGLQHLKLIHFNDSKAPFNACNDHHHDIGSGFITNSAYQSTVKKYQTSTKPEKGDKTRPNLGSVEGLQRVLGWAKILDIPCILETPEEDSNYEEQIRLLNKWEKNLTNLPKRTR